MNPIVERKIIESIVRRYKTQHPDLSFVKLAKVIINNEAQLSGYTSNWLRQIIADILQKTEAEKLTTPPQFNIPDSLYKDPEFYILPVDEYSTLILGDIHIPFHNKQALEMCLNEAKRRNVRVIILNGDIIDFYGLSVFIKDPNYRSVKDELDKARAFLVMLRENFPEATIVFKTGNHEDRWKHFFQKETNRDLYDIPDFQLEYILRLKENRIDFVDDKRVIQAGMVYIIHGHEIFSSRGAVNIARNIRMKANDNVIVNHFHVDQEDIVGTISNKPFGGWAVGCMCGLKPLYNPINNWINSFAFLNLSGDRSFEVEKKKIIDGKIK